MIVDASSFRYLLRREFWVRLFHEVNEDDCWGMAAQLSYYFLLAFFPFLIFVSALVAFLPGVPDLLERLLLDLYRFMPERSYRLVSEILGSVLHSRDEGLLTFGLLTALWFASSAFNSMISLLNRAYRVRDNRGILKTRGLAILVTLVVSVFLILSGILLFFGDWLINLAVSQVALGPLFTLFRWFLVIGLLNVGLRIIYFALPARRFTWRLVSPGSVFATLGLIMGSQGFRLYVKEFGDYQKLWGSLGALIALMIWFYICSFCLVLGGEIDSEIHKMKRKAE